MKLPINTNAAKTLAIKGYMKLRKISPELALAGGIACGIGAVVAGCLCAKHVTKAVEDCHKDLDDIQKKVEEAKENNWPVPLEKDVKEMNWKAYNRMVWKIARALAPAIGLEIASIALFLLSHGVLKQRYLNTTAAYAALQEAFLGYRGRVAEVIGEDAEKVLLAGGKVEKGIMVEGEDGTVTKASGNNLVIKDHKKSPYEFDFNRHTAPLTWNPNPDYTEAFLRQTQNFFNDMLQKRGHVFMNEVLDALGMARTPAGAVCGWYKGAGDDCVDFGYMDSFMRDYQLDSDLCRRNIHLNFNVDGQIWDMI